MMRASFSRATKPANVGAEADVPQMRPGVPWKKILKLSAWAETSGKARPLLVRHLQLPIKMKDVYDNTYGLNRPANVPLGNDFKKLGTAGF